MKKVKRYLKEMCNMFDLPEELYTMNRAVKETKTLRNNVTIIPHLVINGHLNKTKGHVHSTGHKEIYTVLEGTAVFFMQKMRGNTILDCYAVECKKGESCIIPGDYYHITINVGKTELRLSDWSSRECRSDYELMDKKGGGCFYFLEASRAEGFYEAIWNENYKQDGVELRWEKPLKKAPKDLSFLLNL